MNRRAALLALLALVWAGEVGARQLWSRGDAYVEFSGSLRQIVRYSQQTDAERFADAILLDFVVAGKDTCVVAAQFANCPAFDLVGERDAGNSLTRIRTRLDLRATEWLSAVVVYDQEVFAGTLSTLEAGVAESVAEDTFLGAEWTILEGQHVRWTNLFYRAYLQVQTEKLELRVGRQRVAWGVGRLWNPIDRFSAIPPLAIEGDQFVGIDSVEARWNFDGFDYLQLVYAPGTSRDEARFAARFHGVFRDTDVSLMIGSFEKAPTVGFDLARNLADAAIRLEVVFTDPAQPVWRIGDPAPAVPPAYWQVVGSVDINLQIGSGLYLLIEHLYNGNALGFGSGRAGPAINFFESSNTPPAGIPAGALPPGPYWTPASPAIFAASRVFSFARNQTGVSLGYDLTPDLRGDFLVIYDWDGQSAVFFPSLAYNAADFLDLRLGVQAGAGKHLSQYGDAGVLAFLLAEIFF